MAKKYWFLGITFVLALAADEGSKVWAREHLKPLYPEAQVVVKDYFELRYSENPGSAFSLFGGMAGARYFLLVVGVAALGAVGYWAKKAPPESGRLGAELGLLAGGAIGNMWDRALYGKVTDFIVWRYGTHEWPTFNIADVALVVGVLGLALDTWPDAKAQAAAKKAA